VDDLKERELLEQKVIAEFNQAVLRMKHDVLTEMRGNLLQGITKLEINFHGEFVGFEDIHTLAIG